MLSPENRPANEMKARPDEMKGAQSGMNQVRVNALNEDEALINCAKPKVRGD